MCSSRIKSSHRLAILVLSHRILSLITITERTFHSHNRLARLIYQLLRKASDMNQLITDLPLLKGKLFLIIHRLDLTTATLSVQLTGRLCTPVRRLQDFFHPGIAIVFFDLGNPCQDPVSDHSVLDEKGIAVYLAYPFSIMTYIYNFCFYSVILFKAVFSVFHAFLRPVSALLWLPAIIPFWFLSNWNQTVC